MHSNSPEMWKLIRTWLKNCTEKHGTEAPVGHRILPDRIIDVGSPGDPAVYLRLHVDLSEEDQSSRYLTLSHCWGNSQVTKLTEADLSSFQAGIEVLALPKTFQDAVEATRQLGERYIWIDSLCIIQDSAPDWREQSSKMDKIYMDAYCNLAATASPDSAGGLFYFRNAAAIQSLQIPCKWEFRKGVKDRYELIDFNSFQRGQGSFDERLQSLRDEHYERYADGKCQVMDYNRLQRAVEKGPLNSRGWVFQERLLSSRVVHFGAEQIVWECEHVRACETHPDVAPNGPASVTLWTHFLEVKNLAAKLKAGKDRGTESEVYHEWRTIVELYSRMKLTFPTDVLVALSGLAQLVQNATGGEYLAGLWRNDIAHQLLWERIGATDLRGISTCEKFVAPSWSWASTGCTVMWDPFQLWAEDIHLQYLGSSIDMAGYQASHQREKILLRLKARIFTVPCTANKHFGQARQELIPADAPSDWLAIDPYPKRPPKDNMFEVFIKGERYPGWLTFDDPEYEQFFFKHRREFPILFGELKFMPAAFCNVKAYGQRWYGLVLQECEGANTYKRRGRLEIQIEQANVLKALKDSDEGVQEPFTIDLIPYYVTKLSIEAQQGDIDFTVGFHGLDDGKEREITLI